MADGVSSSGGVSGGGDEQAELNSIFLGGEHFMARMKAMSDRKAQIQQALESLQIGHDARAALDAARAKQDEANAAARAATASLAEANRTATKITADANASAKATRQAAEKALKAANQDAGFIRGEAEAKHAEAAKIKQEAVAKSAEHDRLIALAQAKIEEAEAERQRYLGLRAQHEALARRLQDAHHEFLAKITSIASR